MVGHIQCCFIAISNECHIMSRFVVLSWNDYINIVVPLGFFCFEGSELKTSSMKFKDFNKREFVKNPSTFQIHITATAWQPSLC